MQQKTDVQGVRVYRYEGEAKTKAFLDVRIGKYIVKGLKLVEGKNGLFVSMPQEKGKDDKWYDTFMPVTKEAGQALSDIVMAAYNE
jgi:stage V sporulation protein G